MTEPEVYSGPERRRLETIQMEAIEAVVERMMAKLIAHHEVNERAMWDEWMTRAFPEGDPESHRTYHQSKIDAATAEKEFYQTLKVKLAEAGALGLLRMIIWLLMMGLGATLAAKFGLLPAFLSAIGGK